MKNIKIIDNCYALRKAAGQFWLLDLSQPGIPYKRPMSMNEIGADIWTMLIKEYSIEKIVKELSEEYEEEPAQIEVDVRQFIYQLKAYGVKIEE